MLHAYDIEFDVDEGIADQGEYAEEEMISSREPLAEVCNYPDLCTIVLYTDPKKLPKNFDTSQKIIAVDLVVPGGAMKLCNYLGDCVCDAQITPDTIQGIIDRIYLYYKKQGFPLISADFPTQDIGCGVLRIHILESTLSELCFQGSKWSKPYLLADYFDIQPGDKINEKALLKDLYLANRNPFRKSDIIYSPGNCPGTTNVTIYTEERSPFRVYTGVDDTGVRTTGRTRWMVGFNWGHAFFLDHVLSYQYTMSVDSADFQAHTFQYVAPMYWGHIINLYGGFSKARADLNFPGLRNHGTSLQADVRYVIPLGITRHLNHEFAFGFDYKRTNNTLDFNEEFFDFRGNVNLSQFAFRYNGNFEKSKYRLDFDFEFFFSPGAMLGDESDEDYESLRPGAKNQWEYARFALLYHQQLPRKFSFIANMKAQASSTNLLPSEQMGIGGYNSVRGYDERQFNGDNAFLLSLEGRSPPLCFKGIVTQFLGFIDYGIGDDHKRIPDVKKAEWLLGAGPGIRVTYDSYFAGRLDWGIKLHNNAVFTGGWSIFHFAATASY